MGYLLGVFMLAACTSLPQSAVRPALHDFGSAPLEIVNGVFPIQSVDVSAPAWLNTNAMQYRTDAAPSERNIFAQNRWASTPAELLANYFERRFVTVNHSSTGACRLHVDLDEFIQEFSGTAQSVVRISLRVRLLGAGNVPVKQQAFSREMATTSATPTAGVAAFGKSVAQIGTDIQTWLDTQLTTDCTPIAYPGVSRKTTSGY